MKKDSAVIFLKIRLAAVFVCAAMCLAAPAFAAESPQDIVAGAVVDEVTRFIGEREAAVEPAEYGIAIYAIDDETGGLSTEAILLKRLLYGRFSVKTLFRCVDPSEAERVAGIVLEGGRVETASKAALVKLGAELNARYFLTGRLFKTEDNTFFQVFLFDLRDGILLNTPVFDVPSPKAEKARPPAPEKQLVPEFAPEGGLRFFEGESPESHVLDFEVFHDDNGALAAAFLTTSSFEVYRIMPDNKLKRIWQGEYKKTFPRRGTAASLRVLSLSDGRIAVVSMNPFKYSFKYAWEDDKFEKVGNVDDFLVDMLEDVELVSKYGKGVVSFDGAGTFLRTAGGDGNVEKRPLPLPVDYLDGCILNWKPEAPDLLRVAVVDETGVIHVYGSGAKEIMTTKEKFGGGLDCAEHGKELYLAASTASAESDAALLLRQGEEGIREVWRSQTVGGAIYSQKFADFNGDGRDEIAGVLEEESGRQRLFAAAPVYPEKPPASSESPKKPAVEEPVKSEMESKGEDNTTEEKAPSNDTGQAAGGGE